MSLGYFSPGKCEEYLPILRREFNLLEFKRRTLPEDAYMRCMQL